MFEHFWRFLNTVRRLLEWALGHLGYSVDEWNEALRLGYFPSVFSVWSDGFYVPSNPLNDTLGEVCYPSQEVPY